MKLLTLLLVTLTASAQTIRYVDNNPGRGANTAAFVYSTMQAAHDAAAANDIIYVVGSSNVYGGFTVTKPLHFIGPGYQLGNNSQTQANTLEADMNGSFESITFNAGSAGSVIEGVSNARIYINTTNITVRRNAITWLVNLNDYYAHDIVVQQNFITGTVQVGISTSNNVISNNIFIRPNNIGLTVNWQATNIGIINNTFYGAHFMLQGQTTTTCVVTNNIFSVGSISLTAGSAIFSNNILEGVSITNNSGSNISGTNNITNTVVYPSHITGTSGTTVNDVTLFGAAPNPAIDNDFLLTASNPAKGNGTGGVDIGATGGVTPYLLSGMPPVPSVYFFTTPGSGTSTLPNVEVRIKSNN